MFLWLGTYTGSSKSSPGIQKISIYSQSMLSVRLWRHTPVRSI